MLRILKQYYPIRNALFVIGEALVIYTSVLLACLIILGAESFSLHAGITLKTLLITSICQICLYYNDLYDLKVTDSFIELGIRLFQALGASAIILAVIYFVFPGLIVEKGVFIVSICIVILLVVSWRFGYQIILNFGLFNTKIIILGDSVLARNIVNEVSQTKDCGYTIEAVIQENQNNSNKIKSYAGKTIVLNKGYDSLCELARKFRVEKIVVAMEEQRGRFPTRELLNCRTDGIEILPGASFYEMLSGKLLVEHILPGWLIYSEGFGKSRTHRFSKRAVDLLISSTMILLLLPLLAVIAVLIKIDSKGPVFYDQERVGEDRKPYQMYKFRSMVSDAEKQSGPVWAENDDTRITRIGRFIRMWRIDEIPQIWNVLNGEMSFVGPRPERDFFVKQLDDIIPFYGERFNVKPGITGWAQISYGYGASIKDAIEKLNYDLFYIKNMSLFMDLVIVFRTIKIVIFSRGAR